MSWGAVAIGVGSVAAAGIGYLSADKAAEAQEEMTEKSIAEQRRQFNEIRELLSPYVQAGDTALSQQLALIGLGGDEAQQKAIQQIEQSPQFEFMTRQGEEAILQSASATGGLRGGNVQGALAQYRPQVLSSLIENRYNQLGGLVNIGQSSAAGVGAAGQQTSGAISNLMQQQGAIQAGSALAKGQYIGQGIGGLSQAFGEYRANQPKQPVSQSSYGPYRSGYQF